MESILQILSIIGLGLSLCGMILLLVLIVVCIREEHTIQKRIRENSDKIYIEIKEVKKHDD